jgi:hypothetical protein
MSKYQRLPVRIEILSSSENVSLLDNFRESQEDVPHSCEYTAFVDKDGMTQIKTE